METKAEALARTAVEIVNNFDDDTWGKMRAYLHEPDPNTSARDTLRDLVVEVAGDLEQLAADAEPQGIWEDHDWVIACEMASTFLRDAVYAGDMSSLPIARKAFDASALPPKVAPKPEPRIYRIIRSYVSGRAPRTIKTGLTLSEARAHCSRPDTHKAGVWFDGYDRMREYRYVEGIED